MTVWIGQCLCGPARHCIIAVGHEGDEPDAQAVTTHLLRTFVTQALAVRAMHPWCAICGNGVSRWVYEARPSAFATLEEARPRLEASERAQVDTAAALRQISRASDRLARRRDRGW
jgi:hypothetical protein